MKFLALLTISLLFTTLPAQAQWSMFGNAKKANFDQKSLRVSPVITEAKRKVITTL